MAESRGVDVIAVNAPLLALAWIACALRCYARIGLLKNFGLDDLFSVLALFAFTASACLGFANIHYGLGQHMAKLSFPQISKAMELWYFNEIAYIATIMFVKTSICLHLRRLAVGKLLCLIDTIMATTILCGISFVCMAAFQCSPVSYFWTRFLGTAGKCISTQVIADLAYAFTAVDILWDFTLALIPIFLVKDLQMDKKTKRSVAILLMLGSFASIGSVIRIPYFKTLVDSDDFLWANVDVIIWSNIEIALGIIACCLATTKPIFRRVFEWSANRSSRQSPSNTSVPRSRGNTLTKITRVGSKAPFSALNDDNIEYEDIELGIRKENDAVDSVVQHISSEQATGSPSSGEFAPSSVKSEWARTFDSGGVACGMAATSWSMIGSNHSNQGSQPRADAPFPLSPKTMKSYNSA